jgi:hypothetical protein
MNIFYLHPDPYEAAAYHYDKHKVKMILEAAQMLCTAHHHYGNGDNVPYKKAHYNHPSTIWCRENKNHYRWLYNYMLGLGYEYTQRYGKKHLTITKCKEPLSHYPPNIPGGSFKQPPQCMPDEYKVENNSVKAYWNYYINDKKTIINKNEQPYTKYPIDCDRYYISCNSLTNRQYA